MVPRFPSHLGLARRAVLRLRFATCGVHRRRAGVSAPAWRGPCQHWFIIRAGNSVESQGALVAARRPCALPPSMDRCLSPHGSVRPGVACCSRSRAILHGLACGVVPRVFGRSHTRHCHRRLFHPNRQARRRGDGQWRATSCLPRRFNDDRWCLPPSCSAMGLAHCVPGHCRMCPRFGSYAVVQPTRGAGS
ncbi:hypothetical protein HRbin30_00524 [bacterium HR30]|nr:hypothetical protein HRbin30_00524 [bacterium HR30]